VNIQLWGKENLKQIKKWRRVYIYAKNSIPPNCLGIYIYIYIYKKKRKRKSQIYIILTRGSNRGTCFSQ
jgi:hypothetical protein